jgi:hypothetical protein
MMLDVDDVWGRVDRLATPSLGLAREHATW